MGGVAGVCSGVVTNPLDMIRTRQQIRGEHKVVDKNNGDLYRSTWKAARQIVRTEGLLGLQKGLVPAMAFQFVVNGTRIGIFQTAEIAQMLIDPQTGERSTMRCWIWSGIGGLAGSFLSSPLIMVKTQLQAQPSGASAVGDQHRHKGMWDALRTAYRPNGFRGLWRSSPITVARMGMGTAIQLTSFAHFKEMLATSPVSVTYANGYKHCLISIKFSSSKTILQERQLLPAFSLQPVLWS